MSCATGACTATPRPSPKLALAERGLLRQIQQFDGKALGYFALNLREWRALHRAAEHGCLELEPTLPPAVERVVARPLERPCRCIRSGLRCGSDSWPSSTDCAAGRDDAERGFLAGECYALSSRTKVEQERGQKTVETKQGPELCDYRRERKLLELRVGAQTFSESAEDIT